MLKQTLMTLVTLFVTAQLAMAANYSYNFV